MKEPLIKLLEERITILEEKVDIVYDNIKEMAQVSNKDLNNKLEEVMVLLKEGNEQL